MNSFASGAGKITADDFPRRASSASSVSESSLAITWLDAL
jgi:hypothetical protein